MKTEIIHLLGQFLEALPYQVARWDRQVIDRLAHDPQQLARFKAGNAETKWAIYSEMRYG